MKALVLSKIQVLDVNHTPLHLVEVPKPVPGNNEALIKVSACAVCHTELDEIEGRTPPAFFPIIPGHQVVGRIEAMGSGCSMHQKGDRVGIGWIYSTCGVCDFCKTGNEQLCENFKATGRDVNGGYAEYIIAPEKYMYPIPASFTDMEAAPLLCAGAIGYRSLKLSGLKRGESLGFMGFGASAHLMLKIVRYQFPDVNIYVFSRTESERRFALELGAEWAGDIDAPAPLKLERIIDTTPAWKPVVESLANLQKGGRLIINAIRKEAKDKKYLQNISYQNHLWLEKEIKTVANVTALDITEFLSLAAKAGLKPEYQEFPLKEGNKALMELKNQKIKGAKVLRINV